MIVILEAYASSATEWKYYAAIACVVLAVILCILLFVKFTNNVKIALILIGFITTQSKTIVEVSPRCSVD
ncbi:unnamed protein product [Trichobilharzia szidati]|nr:unnamed protein product [Trichobilharzia szidati]